MTVTTSSSEVKAHPPQQGRHHAASAHHGGSGGGGTLPLGRVIGVPVSVGTLASVSGAILALARARHHYVCVANVHMLVTARGEPDFHEVLEQASVVVSDGRPLVWRLRRTGHPGAEQVRGPDLTRELCRRAADLGIPVYFFGAESQDVLEALRARLLEAYPGLQIAGMEAPPILPREPDLDPEVVARIRASGARMVFVGLGCPKQEFWMRTHAPHLEGVLLGVGQAFAIAAGHLNEAPRWAQQSGLEWAFRLAHEPGRLWRRYAVTNSVFIYHLAREMLGRTWSATP